MDKIIEALTAAEEAAKSQAANCNGVQNFAVMRMQITAALQNAKVAQSQLEKAKATPAPAVKQ